MLAKKKWRNGKNGLSIIQVLSDFLGDWDALVASDGFAVCYSESKQSFYLLGGMSDARGRKLVIFSCLMATITFNQMGAMTERSGMSFSARIDAISIDIH